MPVNQAITVSLGSSTNVIASYSVTNPILVLNPSQDIGIIGTTGTTYRLDYRTNLAGGQWLPLTNTLAVPGFNPRLPWPLTNGPAAFYRAVWLPD